MRALVRDCTNSKHFVCVHVHVIVVNILQLVLSNTLLYYVLCTYVYIYTMYNPTYMGLYINKMCIAYGKVNRKQYTFFILCTALCTQGCT